MKFIKSILFLFALAFSTTTFAQKGYEIKFKLANYEGKSAKLGFHYGNKQYIKDSTAVDADGWLIFKGEKDLEPGIYLFIMQPKNVYFEVLVNRGEQHFSMESDTKDIPANMKITNSPDNTLYYQYLNAMATKREISSKIKEDLKKAMPDKKAELEKNFNYNETEIDLYQRDFIKKNDKTFSAKIIKASKDIDLPKFEGTENEVRTKRYFWYKEHFFDNYDMGDERMIRTPLMFNRVDYLVTKLAVQAPDSINMELDKILEKVRPAQDAFKFIVTHYLNFYAKSEIIGHDGIYVHLAKKYYETGQTPWVNKDQLEKIIENANSLYPTLLGQMAKPLSLQLRDGKTVNLYDINSPYTILMFWAPDCGHCKEEMPDVIDFYNKWKSKGVYLLGICNRFDADKIPECWQFMDERPGMKFPVGVDTYLKSNSQTNYYVKSTPMVFILDKDKKIIMKKINPKKLDEVMTELIEIEKEKEKK